MRLIDADRAILALVEAETEYTNKGDIIRAKVVGILIRILWDVKATPTIEAEPVRHGEWIEDGTNIVCSVCKTEFSDEIAFMKRTIDPEKPKRCPECGAKMNGGKDNG